MKNIENKTIYGILLFGVMLTCGGTVRIFAQGQVPGGEMDPELRQEIMYIKGLNDMRLQQYSAIILEKIKDKFPEAELELKVLDLEQKLSTGKFEEVKAIIAEEPDQNSADAWAMKLALADAYYAWGKYPEAKGLYIAFFKQYPNAPPKELNKFFSDSAYRYARMLLIAGDKTGALEAYDIMMRADLPDYVVRQVEGEKGELLVELIESTTDKSKRADYMKQLDKVTEELLWKQDLWFGKAIVYLAHVKMIQGDYDGAMKLVTEYTPQLKQIDKILKDQTEETGVDMTRLSPLAQCRYMMGDIMLKRAQKLMKEPDYDKTEVINLLAGEKKEDGKRSPGALSHFINVFIGYPNTAWAPESGEKAEIAESILINDFGARIKKNVTPEQMEKVKIAQFTGASTLFKQNRFKEAIAEYENILNLFPEGMQSLNALGNLLESYYMENDELMSEVILKQIAEGYYARPEYNMRAGDIVLRMAQTYGSRQMTEKEAATYDLFFNYYTNHVRAPAIYYSFGEKKAEAEDDEGALKYYSFIRHHYKGTPIWNSSMSKIASIYDDQGDYTNEIKVLKEYSEALQNKEYPGQEYITTQYRLADVTRKLGGDKNLAEAYKMYASLYKTLSDEETLKKYQKDAEQAKLNSGIKEAALFYQGFCLAMINTSNEDVNKKYKMKAIELYTSLVEQYPKSEFGPSCLSQIGTLYTMFDDAKGAEEALTKLKDMYPNSEEAKNADFVLAMNLLKLGRRRQAVIIFKQMFTGSGKYSTGQILQAGEELAAANEDDIALEAFNKVLSMTDSPGTEQKALVGKARILRKQGDYEQAVEVLKELFDKHKNSAYTVEASMMLSKSYLELAAKEPDENKRSEYFTEAVKAMKTVRLYAQKDEKLKIESDLEVAGIQMKRAEAEEKFGGSEEDIQRYKNMALAQYKMITYTNPNKPGVAPYIEEAYMSSFPLMIEAGHYEDAYLDADEYFRQFPDGRYASEVRSAKNTARIKLAAAGKPLPTLEDNFGEEE
jgi:TolA-binding protein